MQRFCLIAASLIYLNFVQLPPNLVAYQQSACPPTDDCQSEKVSVAGSSPFFVSKLQNAYKSTTKPYPMKQFLPDEPVRPFQMSARPTTLIPGPMTVDACGRRVVSQLRFNRMDRVCKPSPTHSQKLRSLTPQLDNIMHRLTPPVTHRVIFPGHSNTPSQSSSLVIPASTADQINKFSACNAPELLISTPSVLLPVIGDPIGGTMKSHWSQQHPFVPQKSQYLNSFKSAELSYLYPPSPVLPPSHSPNSGPKLPETYDRDQSAPQQIQPTFESYNSKSYPPPPSSAIFDQDVRMMRPNMHISDRLSVFTMPIDASPTSYENAQAETTKNLVSEDEERFVFSQDFITATAILFDEEVLPAYPDYPGKSSGLCTPGLQSSLLETSYPRQTGELYASRVRKNYPSPSSAPPSSLLPPISATYDLQSNGVISRPSDTEHRVPVCVPNYSSSLLGWAG